MRARPPPVSLITPSMTDPNAAARQRRASFGDAEPSRGELAVKPN